MSYFLPFSSHPPPFSFRLGTLSYIFHHAFVMLPHSPHFPPSPPPPLAPNVLPFLPISPHFPPYPPIFPFPPICAGELLWENRLETQTAGDLGGLYVPLPCLTCFLLNRPEVGTRDQYHTATIILVGVWGGVWHKGLGRGDPSNDEMMTTKLQFSTAFCFAGKPHQCMYHPLAVASPPSRQVTEDEAEMEHILVLFGLQP